MCLYSSNKYCLSRFWGSVLELYMGGKAEQWVSVCSTTSIIYLVNLCFGARNNVSVLKRIMLLNKVRKSHWDM